MIVIYHDKQYVVIGDCISGFCIDHAECQIPQLPYQDVTDFACDLESAIKLDQFEIKSDQPIVEETFELLSTDLGVMMLHDTENDIHYFLQ